MMKKSNKRRSLLIGLLLTPLAFSCNYEKVIFYDDFRKESEGKIVDNVIQLPPPAGLGYDWKVLLKGALPVNWIPIDELDNSDPKKGFWVIPPDSGYLEQGGRSHNSVLFANIPVPGKTAGYDISFRQYRSDNDYIGYIIGAAEPGIDQGIEFGYMTQVPGTDSTTTDAYVNGALGEKVVPGAAHMHKWVNHLISVREDSVMWFVNKHLIAAAELIKTKKSGYFGIRQRYERGTRYDEVKITTVAPKKSVTIKHKK